MIHFKRLPAVPFIAALLLTLALAQSCLAHGEIHEIISSLSKQIKANPKNAKLYLQRSEYYLKHQDYKKALNDLDTVKKLDASLELRLLLLAQIQNAQGKTTEAMGNVNTYINNHPKEHSAYKLRSELHDALGKQDLAEQDFARAIQLHPRPPLNLFISYYSLLKKNGKPEQALSVFDDAIRALGPLPSILEAKASTLGLAGKHEEASAVYQRLRTQYPSLAFTWWRDEAKMWEATHPEKSLATYRAAEKAWTSLPKRTRTRNHMKQQFLEIQSKIKSIDKK